MPTHTPEKTYSPAVSEFNSSTEAQAYSDWLHNKIEQAVQNGQPTIAHDEAAARIRAKLNQRLNQS